MHCYVLVRGVKHWADYFISQLQGKYLPMKITKGAGNRKPGEYHAPIQVRPITMYEIVFPKEHQDIMLTTLLGERKNQYLS